MATIYKTLTINAGQSGYLPKNSVILAKSETGDAVAVSECVDLSVVGQYECRRIVWKFEGPGGGGGGGTGPWNVEFPQNAIFSLRIGDTEYSLNTTLAVTDSTFYSLIEAAVPGLFQNMSLTYTSEISTERIRADFNFRVPSQIASSVALVFVIGRNGSGVVTDETQFFTAFSVSSTDCPEPNPGV